jgi:hypothetical protein
VLDRVSGRAGVVVRVVIAHMGGVGDLGCRVMWCPKYRDPMPTAAIKDRYKEYEWPWCTVRVGDA